MRYTSTTTRVIDSSRTGQGRPDRPDTRSGFQSPSRPGTAAGRDDRARGDDKADRFSSGAAVADRPMSRCRLPARHRGVEALRWRFPASIPGPERLAAVRVRGRLCRDDACGRHIEWRPDEGSGRGRQWRGLHDPVKQLRALVEGKGWVYELTELIGGFSGFDRTQMGVTWHAGVTWCIPFAPARGRSMARRGNDWIKWKPDGRDGRHEHPSRHERQRVRGRSHEAC